MHLEVSPLLQFHVLMSTADGMKAFLQVLTETF